MASPKQKTPNRQVCEHPWKFPVTRLVWIRRFLRAGESELVSHLINCLANRLAKRVHSRVSASLNWSLVDDSAQEVMIEIARRITDLDSDKDDFAQTRFGLWLERVTYNSIRPHIRTQRDTRAKQADIEEVEQSNGKKKAANFEIDEEEPHVALCGVDNQPARAALEDVGFVQIIEAGLGRGIEEYLAFQMHCFPADCSARERWVSR